MKINTRQVIALHNTAIKDGPNMVSRVQNLLNFALPEMGEASFIGSESEALIHREMHIISRPARWGRSRIYTVLFYYVHVIDMGYKQAIILSRATCTSEYLGRSLGWYASSEGDLLPITWGEDLSLSDAKACLQKHVRIAKRFNYTGVCRVERPHFCVPINN